MPDSEITVFVVDDDPSIRKSLSRLFRSSGFNVEAYASGREFLARLPFSGRGCAILDLLMPEMSGQEVCAQIAAQCPSLPSIFLTANEYFLRAAQPCKGAYRYFTKPVDAELLLSAVRDAIQNASPTPSDNV